MDGTNLVTGILGSAYNFDGTNENVNFTNLTKMPFND